MTGAQEGNERVMKAGIGGKEVYKELVKLFKKVIRRGEPLSKRYHTSSFPRSRSPLLNSCSLFTQHPSYQPSSLPLPPPVHPYPFLITSSHFPLLNSCSPFYITSGRPSFTLCTTAIHRSGRCSTVIWQRGTSCCPRITWSRSVTSALPKTSTRTTTTRGRVKYVCVWMYGLDCNGFQSGQCTAGSGRKT